MESLIILNYISIFIYIFGSIGNILVYKIYSSAALQKYSMSTYFRAIAIFDNLNLISLLAIYFINQFGIDLSHTIDFFCKSQVYFTYTNGPISVWLMVAISIDRYFNIAYPKRFPILVNKKFQLMIIIGLFLFNYVFYSFIIWDSFLVVTSSTNGTNVTMCKNNYNNFVIGWMDFFNSTAVPILLMIIFSWALILSIHKSRTRIHHANNKGTSNVRDRKFAMTSLSLNLIFLILLGPVELFNIVTATAGFTLTSSTLNYNLIAYVISEPYYFNYAIGFYVQLVANSVFRKEFLKLLKKSKLLLFNT